MRSDLLRECLLSAARKLFPLGRQILSTTDVWTFRRLDTQTTERSDVYTPKRLDT